MSNELTGQKATPVAGVLGTKLGMTQVWDENGKLVPVTVVQTGANVVTQVRSVETDGYDAVQIAFGQILQPGVEHPGHRQIQNRIAQELQPLVVVGRKTAVGGGTHQQLAIGKNMLQSLLQC